MKKWNFVIAGLLVVLGILIIAFPAFFVILLGAGAIAYGIYNILYTKKMFEDTSFGTIILIRCILSIVIGILAIFFPMAIGKTAWNIMIYVLGIYLIFVAGLGFYSMYSMNNKEVDIKNFLYENLGLLAVSIVLFLMPGFFGSVFKVILGILAILSGVGLALYTNYLNKKEDYDKSDFNEQSSTVEKDAEKDAVKDNSETSAETNTEEK